AAGWAFQGYAAKEEATPEIRYTDLYALLDAGKVDSVTLRGLQVNGKLKASETVNGKSVTSFHTLLPAMEDRAILPLFRDKGVVVTVQSEEQPIIVRLLSAVLPWVVILGLWMWMSRRAQNLVSSSPFGRMMS